MAAPARGPYSRAGRRVDELAEPPAPAVTSARARAQGSFGLWVAVVWYALETSRSVTRWMTALGYEVAESSAAEGSPIDRAVITVLLILAIGILLRRRVNFLSVLANNRFVCLLFVYMLVSIVWSGHPDVSFRRWTRSLVDLMMVLVVMTDRDPFEAACTLIRRVMFVNIPLSIYFIKYVPAIGRSYNNVEGLELWLGTTTQKNVLGEVAMTAAIYFLFETIRNYRLKKLRTVGLYLVYLVMTGWILRGSEDSTSATSLALVFLGAIILLGFSFIQTRRRYSALFGFAGLLIACVVVSGVLVFQVSTGESAIGASIETTGRDTTLTGRTDLWKDVWRIAQEHSIVGVGFGAFWIGNTHNLWDVHVWRPTQGHNGYLDVFVELGAVGILLLACTIIAGFAGTIRTMKTRFEIGALNFVFVTLIVVHNITESSYLRGTVDLWFLFLLSTVTVPLLPPAREQPQPLPGSRTFTRGPDVSRFGSHRIPAVR